MAIYFSGYALVKHPGSRIKAYYGEVVVSQSGKRRLHRKFNTAHQAISYATRVTARYNDIYRRQR